MLPYPQTLSVQVADIVSQAKGSQTGSLAAAKAEAVALAAADAVAMAEALAAHNMGEQLLAEEEQQKTKAAAKKARRGRQKAKKQAEALKLQESKLPGPGCSALPAAVSSAENPATDVLSLFCCPITKVRFQDPCLDLLYYTHNSHAKSLNMYTATFCGVCIGHAVMLQLLLLHCDLSKLKSFLDCRQ